MEDITDADCVIVAVAHNEFKQMGLDGVMKLFGDKKERVLIDVKGLYKVEDLEKNDVIWWRL